MTPRGPGQAFFSFVRHWSRLSRSGDGSSVVKGRLVLVSEAANSLITRGEAATVNAIASQLGIDQSGASRLVKTATDAGYLKLEPCRGDGRRHEVSLTEAGEEALGQAHRWQDEVFGRLTEGWSEAELNAFCRAMDDLIVRSDRLDL
jgi:MarR family transcriptional regulator, organic hydroperoxide resistance regulator